MTQAGAYAGPERRLSPRSEDGHAVHLEGLIERAIRESLASVKLVDAETHERHHDYIAIVLAREADRAALRKAVIEKTLAGLVWAGIVWLGTYLAGHWKP